MFSFTCWIVRLTCVQYFYGICFLITLKRPNKRKIYVLCYGNIAPDCIVLWYYETKNTQCSMNAEIKKIKIPVTTQSRIHVFFQAEMTFLSQREFALYPCNVFSSQTLNLHPSSLREVKKSKLISLSLTQIQSYVNAHNI